MSKTRYTGVTKDNKTGKYTYYFKAGVDLATGKTISRAQTWLSNCKRSPLKHELGL